MIARLLEIGIAILLGLGIAGSLLLLAVIVYVWSLRRRGRLASASVYRRAL